MKKISGWASLPKSGVIIIFGHRGEGKSGLAWWLAERKHQHRTKVVALDLSNVAKKLLPKWVKHISTHRELTKERPCLVIADEAAFKVHARRSQSDANVEWTQLVSICRQKEHLLIFICQHTRQLDVGIVTEADIVIFKRPSLLHLRFARPELKPELQEAYDKLAGRKRSQKNLCYVVDYHYGPKGMLRNHLPTFWSEKLSKSFSAFEFKNKEKKKK